MLENKNIKDDDFESNINHENDNISIVDEFKSFIWHLSSFKEERKKQNEIKKLEKANKPIKPRKTFKEWVSSLLAMPELMAWNVLKLKEAWKKSISSRIESAKAWTKVWVNLFKQKVSWLLRVPELESWSVDMKFRLEEGVKENKSTISDSIKGWFHKIWAFFDKFKMPELKMHGIKVSGIKMPKFKIPSFKKEGAEINTDFVENLSEKWEQISEVKELTKDIDLENKEINKLQWSKDHLSTTIEQVESDEIIDEQVHDFSKEQQVNKDLPIEEVRDSEKLDWNKIKETNMFSEMWEDIFQWIIEDKNKEIKWKKLNIEHSKSSEVLIWWPKEPIYKSFLSLLNVAMPYVLIVFISISIWVYMFFEIVLDKENRYLGVFNVNNLWAQVYAAEGLLAQKERSLESLKRQIDRELVDIPSRIYYKSLNYKNLPDYLKDKLATFYNDKTWMIKVWKNVKLIEELRELFRSETLLASMKLYFEKEHVLNSVIEEKIYWKEVYKDLQEATNNTFKYNEILNYITYDNFSVDENWKISVSWLVTDPSWKVFSQLINLVNTINDHDSFNWASISTFSKTVNSNKEVWWMVSPLNLSFFYKSNNE